MYVWQAHTLVSFTGCWLVSHYWALYDHSMLQLIRLSCKRLSYPRSDMTHCWCSCALLLSNSPEAVLLQPQLLPLLTGLTNVALSMTLSCCPVVIFNICTMECWWAFPLKMGKEWLDVVRCICPLTCPRVGGEVGWAGSLHMLENVLGVCSLDIGGQDDLVVGASMEQEGTALISLTPFQVWLTTGSRTRKNGAKPWPNQTYRDRPCCEVKIKRKHTRIQTCLSNIIIPPLETWNVITKTTFRYLNI